MKKIGIVTCYFKNNYGSMLQAYATKKILDNNDIPNETINIDYNQDFKKGKRKYYSSGLGLFGMWIRPPKKYYFYSISSSTINRTDLLLHELGYLIQVRAKSHS